MDKSDSKFIDVAGMILGMVILIGMIVAICIGFYKLFSWMVGL